MDVQQFIKHLFANIGNRSISANTCIVNKIIEMGSTKCFVQNILQLRNERTKAFYIAGIELKCCGFLSGLLYLHYHALCVLHFAIICEDNIDSFFYKA